MYTHTRNLINEVVRVIHLAINNKFHSIILLFIKEAFNGIVAWCVPELSVSLIYGSGTSKVR